MYQSLGTDGIIKKIRETVGNAPVYLSIDVGAVFQIHKTSIMAHLNIRSILSTLPLLPPRVRQRLEAGPLASFAQS